jgi:hypothetical protein
MLLQRAGTGTIAPPEFTPPPWESLSQTWKNAPQPASPTIVLGPADVSLGHDDKEADDLSPGGDEAAAGHEFGWDNENPRRTVHVGQFRAEWRPITNGEFLAFFRAATPGSVSFPKSWVESEGQVQVRTLHGPVPMDVARDWPVVSDCNGLSAYAASKGGRLPSDAELRLFYDTFDCGYAGGANVGFRNWHPVPYVSVHLHSQNSQVSLQCDDWPRQKQRARAQRRGVGMDVHRIRRVPRLRAIGTLPRVRPYPCPYTATTEFGRARYSADFFDGCHNVVVRGVRMCAQCLTLTSFHCRWVARTQPFRGWRNAGRCATHTSGTTATRGLEDALCTTREI